MVNPLFKTPQTPIGQFQTAFRSPHLNATFPSTFQIYKHQEHLEKVWAPTRTVVVCNNNNNKPWSEEWRKEEFIYNIRLLICMTVNFSSHSAIITNTLYEVVALYVVVALRYTISNFQNIIWALTNRFEDSNVLSCHCIISVSEK